MVSHKNQIGHLERWLYIFIIIHVVAWTIVPFLTRHTLPMDAMEGTIWGRQFELGYDKNPFLNGWLTAVAVSLGGPSGWAVYLFSQLSVAVCFWAIWELGKKMLPPIYALLAVLLLEGVQYYNVHAIDFNDNTLELGLWALTALFFYQALRTQSWRDWILTGVFAGLGMMTKYYTAMLLLPMALFLVVDPECRKSFQKPQTYAGLFVFLAIIMPHVIWLFFHDFVTVDYALDRVSSKPAWFNHFNYSALFAWQQIEAFLPPILLALLLAIGKRPFLSNPRVQITPFNQQFLLYVGLGPFLLTVLLSAVTGIRLRAGWGEPLLSLWGIILIAWLQPRITPRRFYRFAVLFFTLLGITLASYAAALIRADEPSSANFPGKIIATNLTTLWHDTYHTPLPYVAGSRWLAGNIAFYSTDKPAVYINWDKKLSPWVNEASLTQQGAIFVWDASEDNEPPVAQIKARFQKLGTLQIMHFSWLRNNKSKPVEISIAFLPPTKVNTAI
jgi:4-amino-4-deoxy-L-arabinose transferase-like glycosyltransferase